MVQNIPDNLEIMNSKEAAAYLHISRDLLLDKARIGAIPCVALHGGSEDVDSLETDERGRRKYHNTYIFSKQSLNEWFMREQETYMRRCR